MTAGPRPAGEAFIDANLLVLLVVGSVGRRQVGVHRRARRFTPEDYERLLGMIGALERVLVTPNTLTEASNLLKSRSDRRSDRRFLDRLRLVIDRSEEVVVASAEAARNAAFPRLGLTDAALLEAVSEERPLITTDLDLYIAALSKGENAAFNFTHTQNFG